MEYQFKCIATTTSKEKQKIATWIKKKKKKKKKKNKTSMDKLMALQFNSDINSNNQTGLNGFLCFVRQIR